MKQTTFYVTGMHCSACELLIEKKLLQSKNITGVDASLKDGRVLVYSEKKLPYSLEGLNNMVKDLGYTLTIQKPESTKQKKQPIIYYIEGQQGLKFNREEFFRQYEWIVVVVSLFIGWKIINGLEVGQYMNPEGSEGMLGIAFLGLIASVSSCAALIGGLLLSLTKQWHEKTLLEPASKKSVPHIQFHVGRVVSFALFGGILGAIGDLVTLDNTTVYAVLVVLVSLVMVVLSLQMLGVQWANKVRIRMPSSLAKNVLEHPKRGPFLIGAGTFFLPCGFTLIAQALALASGSFFAGLLIMALFAVGTLPVLFGISFFGMKMNSKPLRTARFNKYAGILVLLFALYNLNGQFNVLGLPSLSDLKSVKSVENLAEVQTNKEGEQIISIMAKGFRYMPTSNMTIQSGVPTKLIVDDQGMQGCGVFLAVSGLMNGFVSLKPGENVVNLGVPQKGNYKITCSMGMVTPVLLRVM